MPTPTWRDMAQCTIKKALAEAEARSLGPDETQRYVNAAYPFGQRAYHPYKIWLREMQHAFNPANPIPPAQANLAQRKAQNDAIAARDTLIAQGQLELL